jgi:hypothetical protein
MHESCVGRESQSQDYRVRVGKRPLEEVRRAVDIVTRDTYDSVGNIGELAPDSGREIGLREGSHD